MPKPNPRGCSVYVSTLFGGFVGLFVGQSLFLLFGPSPLSTKLIVVHAVALVMAGCAGALAGWIGGTMGLPAQNDDTALYIAKFNAKHARLVKNVNHVLQQPLPRKVREQLEEALYEDSIPL